MSTLGMVEVLALDAASLLSKWPSEHPVQLCCEFIVVTGCVFLCAFCCFPTSQLLSTESGEMMRVALVDKSSVVSVTEDSTPAHTKKTDDVTHRRYIANTVWETDSGLFNILFAAVVLWVVFIFFEPLSVSEPPSAAAKNRSSCNTGAAAQ